MSFAQTKMPGTHDPGNTYTSRNEIFFLSNFLFLLLFFHYLAQPNALYIDLYIFLYIQFYLKSKQHHMTVDNYHPIEEHLHGKYIYSPTKLKSLFD